MDFVASAKLQGRAIFALAINRMRTRYLGSRAGYVWALVEPIAWVFVLKLAIQHSGTDKPPLGDSFEVFFVTGVCLARMWRVIVSSVSAIVVGGRTTRLPGLIRLDLCYAQWALETVTAGLVIIIALAILALFGFHAAPGDLLHCVIAFFAMALFGLAFALTLAVVLVIAPGFQHFSGLLLLLMFVTSGFAFLVDRMPIRTREIVLWNPLVHFIEWFREGFFEGYQCRSLDLSYVFTLAAICLVIGLAGERAFRRHAGRQTTSFDESDV